MNNRELWIDSVKGWGVLLIIIGHLLYESSIFSPIINKIIYTFHIPVFFLISGYLFKNNKMKGIIKKLERLIIPFLGYTIIGIPIFGLGMYLQGNNIYQITRNFLYVDGVTINQPLWFLIVLFEVYLIAFLFNISNIKKSLQILLLFAFSIIGFIVYQTNPRFLNYFGINRAIVCFTFFLLGVILKRLNIQEKRWLLYIAIFMNIIFGVVFNTKISIYSFSLGNYISFFIAAVSGSIAMIIFCKIYFNNASFLTDLSKYSILFLGTQYFWIVPIKLLIKTLKLTNIYDLLVIPIAIIYVLFMPKLYEILKNKFKIAGILNGE